MEDSHISIDDLSRYYPEGFAPFKRDSLVHSFYGIYDGHVGSRAARYASDTLHDRIFQGRAFDILSPTTALSDDDRSQHDEAGSVNQVVQAIHEGFLQTDKEFIGVL